jgi:uncharacterized protein YkwD
MKNFLIVFLFFFSDFALGQDLYLEVFNSLNTIRRERGLQVLKHNRQLSAAAQSQSDWMAQVGRMDHLRDRPPSSFNEYKVCNYHPVNRVINSGYYKFYELFDILPGSNGVEVRPKSSALNNVDEIIAAGKAPGKEAYRTDIIVKGWTNSPGHKKSILTPNYEEMGIGISSPRQGEVYWCVVFANR